MCCEGEKFSQKFFHSRNFFSIESQSWVMNLSVTEKKEEWKVNFSSRRRRLVRLLLIDRWFRWAEKLIQWILEMIKWRMRIDIVFIVCYLFSSIFSHRDDGNSMEIFFNNLGPNVFFLCLEILPVSFSPTKRFTINK